MREMPKLNNVEPPKDERTSGEVTFNYASYDGRYVVGESPWSFETRWSAGGAGAAHLYNDPTGIDGVAIAEGVTSIGQVTPAVVNAADFTSRTRMPRVGQVALLRNTAGFYAAIQPLEIGHSAIPSENIMRLRFAIQTDQTTDFSSFENTFDDRRALVEQVLAYATDAERALHAVQTNGDLAEIQSIGIGHNQPPAEFAITEGDRAETKRAIATIRQEMVSSSPALEKLSAAGQTVARTARKIANWVAAKADSAADEFAKTIGKAAAVAVVGGIGLWMTLQSKLVLLAALLLKFTG